MNPNAATDTKSAAQLAEIRKLEAQRREHAAKARALYEQIRALKHQ